MVEQYEKLPPVYDIIVDAFRESVADTKEISIALEDLNATQIELMLLYVMAPELLSAKEQKKMIDNLKSIWDEPDETVIQERLDGIIRGDEYV